MKYKANSLRMLVSTFGDSFEPTTRAPLHMLAQSMPGSGDIHPLLDKVRKEWGDTDFNSSEAAMTNLRTEIGTRLTSALGDGTYTVESSPPFYLPILDLDGKVIGHDTIGWLLRDGEPISQYAYEPARPDLGTPGEAVGMVACLYLSIGVKVEASGSTTP